MSEAHDAFFDLLDRRGPDKTICPSEAARLIAHPHGNWRDHMDAVHQAVDTMATKW